jgi:hypothetical protein
MGHPRPALTGTPGANPKFAKEDAVKYGGPVLVHVWVQYRREANRQ